MVDMSTLGCYNNHCSEFSLNMEVRLMKVIKRDGREVNYDRNKIIIAIQKANDEVPVNEKISDEKIHGIVASIEKLGTGMLQVEEIQDIIEQKLMAERNVSSTASLHPRESRGAVSVSSTFLGVSTVSVTG